METLKAAMKVIDAEIGSNAYLNWKALASLIEKRCRTNKAP